MPSLHSRPRAPFLSASTRAAQISSVRVVFIRHGESEWNDVFNKGLGPVRHTHTL
jgi:hypothetical protein